MKHLIVAAAVVAGLLAGPAFAGTEICKVELSSAEAGRLEVRKVIQPPKVEAVYPASGLVFSHWSPPASGSMVLVIDYVAHDQDKSVGGVNGIRVDFPMPNGVTEDQLSAEITADGMAPLHLDHAAMDMDTGGYGFALDADRPADRAMGHLIGTGARVKVVIFQADWVFQPEMFEGTQMRLKVLGEPKAILSEEIDTTATAARDALFVRGKAPVVGQDPKVCTQVQ